MATTRPNGKGDRPRKVNGPKYRDNFDTIKWKEESGQSKINKIKIQLKEANRKIKELCSLIYDLRGQW